MRDKRSDILASAEHEFLEKGYDGTSIDAIVREVGGSKSTIYSHFRDKGVLFAETLTAIRRELDFSLPHADTSSSDVTEVLTLLGVEFLTTLYSERALHLFRTVIAESQRFPDVARQLMDDGFSVSVQRIAAALDYNAGAQSRSLDPHSAARDFVALLTGERHLRLLMQLEPAPDAATIAAAAARAAGTITAALQADS